MFCYTKLFHDSFQGKDVVVRIASAENCTRLYKISEKKISPAGNSHHNVEQDAKRNDHADNEATCLCRMKTTVKEDKKISQIDTTNALGDIILTMLTMLKILTVSCGTVEAI